VLPPDGGDPVAAVDGIAAELEGFSPTLAARDRWLILNKTDLLADDEREAICADIVTRLDWQGPVYKIAAIGADGTAQLCGDIMTYLEEIWDAEKHDPERAEKERELQVAMQAEARERIQALAAERKAARQARNTDEDDDGDYDVDVEYVQ
jgi:GTPase